MLSQYTNTTQSTSSGATAAAGIFVVFYLLILIFMIVAWVKIVSKAGYSGLWVLLGIVPLVNIVMFFVFAFSRWPVLDQGRGPGSFTGGTPMYADRSQAYLAPRGGIGAPPPPPPPGFGPPPVGPPR